MNEGTKPTALVVDDDAIIRDLAAEMLNGFDYQVRTAGSGEEALQILESEPAAFSLVLLDLNMRGLSGTETLAKIRDNHPELPVVLMSGLMTDQTAGELMEQGATWILKKPFHIESLKEAIRKALER